MEGGNLSWRVREALERVLESGVSSVADQEEHSDSLEQRVEKIRQRLEELEKDVSSMLEAGLTEARPEVNRRLDGFTQTLGEMNDRVARLEQAIGGGHAGVEPRTAGSEKENRQVYETSSLSPGVVSKEPHPGEENSYGPGMALVEEWRRLNRERDAGAKLTQTKTRERIMELEIAMLDEHRLTLPPGTSPLDDFTRGADLDWRRRALAAIQQERVRRELLRWVRRVLTLGVWWN